MIVRGILERSDEGVINVFADGIEPLRADALDVASLERIAERLDLLKRKEFAAADAIRDALAVEGILLKDGRDAATGERTTSWERRR